MNEFLPLFLSLALGLLVGLERGWKEVTESDNNPFFGLRSFGLIGLFGGITGFLSTKLENTIIIAVIAASFMIFLTALHIYDSGREHGVGITTTVAAAITFLLGVLSSLGYMSVASSLAVLTAVLMSLKPFLYKWIRKLEAKEMYATLKLLLISVVLLPVLPDKGFGPWGALNPYQIWWIVVLIAGISFAGYFAMKIAGAGKGIMLTGILGGFASSTAVTLSFSKMGKGSPLKRIFSAGILIACATMFPRMILIVSVINPQMLKQVAAPLAVSGVIVYAGMAVYWVRRTKDKHIKAETLPVSNPFQLAPALQFAAVLAAITFLSHAFSHWFGDTGVIILGFISGLTDVDAITISMARLANDGLSSTTASAAILAAAATNTLVKGTLALFIAGKGIGARVLSVFALALACGALTLFITA
jgi:uncharacterized membrane protein (DUF4010 family)